MKRYKLLKDLPRAKAGEVVIITNAHSNNPWILKINKWNEDEAQQTRLAYIHKNDISEWLEEANPKSIYDLKRGDEFWVISSSNDISQYTITDYEFFERNFLNTCNVFTTFEEASQERNKRISLHKIKKYCHENDIQLFSDKEINKILKNNIDEHRSKLIQFFYIYYSAIGNTFKSSSWNSGKHTELLPFKKEEDAKKVIKNCESDLKIIFNV